MVDTDAYPANVLSPPEDRHHVGGWSHSLIAATVIVASYRTASLSYLIDTLLTGTDPSEVTVFAGQVPVLDDDYPPEYEYVVVSYCGQFGVLRYSDPDHPAYTRTIQAAVNPAPPAEPPSIFYDSHNQDPDLTYPAWAVWPVEEIKRLLRAYLLTGTRPASVNWRTINA